MRINVTTLFPDLIMAYCSKAILGRAQKEKIISVNAINLRDFTTDKHRTVDDTPYGGGPGMVMKAEPIYRALASLRALTKKQKIKKTRKQNRMTILLSPRGRQFDQRLAEEWSTFKEITFVCGRYEGVDQRVADYMVDEEVSIGPYVLAGGELGALVIIEAIARLIPGVLGNEESLLEETFNIRAPRDLSALAPTHKNRKKKSVQVEYPQYTKPAVFRRWRAPKVLLSGDHKKIVAWRKNM